MSDWDFDGYDFVDDFGNPIPMDSDGADDPANYDPCGDDYDCEDDRDEVLKALGKAEAAVVLRLQCPARRKAACTVAREAARHTFISR